MTLREEVQKLRLDGYSYKAIGIELGVSKSYAFSLFTGYKSPASVSPEYKRKYRLEHLEEANKSRTKYALKIKNKVFQAYGGYECVCCRETEPTFLTIDHINGGGTKHRKEVGGGASFYLWLRKEKYPKGFQVLCYNCNLGRAKNGGICPHVTER